MIKSIPVFGSQELFDGAPECAELVGHSGGFYRITPDGVVYCGGCTFTTDEYRNLGFIAMRRIEETPEPKRWTIEDQNAGRLPDVGAEVLNNDNGRKFKMTVVFINSVSVCIKDEDNCLYVVTHKEIDPIETPEEKAARLEREFVQSFCTNDVVYERGLRDAYRKLNVTQTKAGE